MLTHQAMNDSMLEVLEEIFDTHQYLFALYVPDKERLRQRVQFYCTLHRKLDTRALQKKVGPSDSDIVNHWKALKQANGKRPQ
jgi:hypothetical protein